MSKKVKKSLNTRIVEAIQAKKYVLAKKLIRESLKRKLFKAFLKEQDAQSVPGNKVTSTDLPGSPAETDGDAIGAGEGVPSDFEGKGSPEVDGRGASGPSSAGDDPGSSGLDSGGIGKKDADYGPAVVTEEDDDEDDSDNDDDKSNDDDDDKKDKKDKKDKEDKDDADDDDDDDKKEELAEFLRWRKAKKLAEQDDEDDDDDAPYDPEYDDPPDEDDDDEEDDETASGAGISHGSN